MKARDQPTSLYGRPCQMPITSSHVITRQITPSPEVEQRYSVTLGGIARRRNPTSAQVLVESLAAS